MWTNRGARGTAMKALRWLINAPLSSEYRSYRRCCFQPISWLELRKRWGAMSASMWRILHVFPSRRRAVPSTFPSISLKRSPLTQFITTSVSRNQNRWGRYYEIRSISFRYRQSLIGCPFMRYGFFTLSYRHCWDAYQRRTMGAIWQIRLNSRRSWW